ncbi:hypothetical protein V8954_04005 [Klebsiella michiganensis]|uniref:tail fiber/spike domain-containing protein n=1 Tax=Klebsiella michiganensis TaxID=1134687 RepID=UPI0030CEE542
MALTLLATNNAESFLSSAISATDTSLIVSAGTGAEFPDVVAGESYFKLTITDAATGSQVEIVNVTAKAGDIFTIERAQEGTTAKSWLHNDFVANMMTAGTINYVSEIAQELNQSVQQSQAAAEVATTAAEEAVTTLGSTLKQQITFTTGGTLNSALDRISDGTYLYYWTGTFPKIVPPSSTVDSTGGQVTGAWACDTALPLSQNLSSDDPGSVSVNYIHVFNVPTRPFAYYLAKNHGDIILAIKEAAASGKSIIFEAGETYDISENDIPFAQRTEFNGPDGGYVNFNITNPFGSYGTFDLRTTNGLNGGRYNRFRNLRFRYPNQVTKLDSSITAPVAYPPTFHGGAFESRFECLDMGNTYIAFRIGGVVDGVDSGTASRVVFEKIIGAPIYRGLQLTQVRDVPIIENIRWNYNYLDGSTSPYAYDMTLKQWMHDNAAAFRFGRIDWATIVNLFAYGYLYTFLEQAWGYTGSADRLKFIGCTADHSVYPVYAQNFSNNLTFVACGFTGDFNSEFTRIAPNIIYINDVGDSSASVSFIGCTFNNFSGSVLRTNGTIIETIGGEIWGFGYDSSASLIRNAIELTASAIVKINGTKIDASASAYTRCVYDGGYGNSELHLSGGAKLTGATYESYRWDGGANGGNKEYIEHNVTIEGATSSINARGVISFYRQRYAYPGNSMPTSGTYNSGDEVRSMSNTILGSPGSRYIITGWRRVTTGSSHVLNTDWVAIKIPTGD